MNIDRVLKIALKRTAIEGPFISIVYDLSFLTNPSARHSMPIPPYPGVSWERMINHLISSWEFYLDLMKEERAWFAPKVKLRKAPKKLRGSGLKELCLSGEFLVLEGSTIEVDRLVEFARVVCLAMHADDLVLTIGERQWRMSYSVEQNQ